MGSRRCLVIAVTVLTAVATACTSGETDPITDASAVPTTTPTGPEPDEVGSDLEPDESPVVTDASSAGSGDNAVDGVSTNSSGMVVVVDAGAEPRSRLRLADGDFSLQVDAVDIEEAAAGPSGTAAEYTASYVLDVEVRADDDGGTVRMLPSISSIEAPTRVPADLGALRWTVDSSGVVTRIAREQPDLLLGPELERLLHPAMLVLPVPDEPVGSGAVWHRVLDRNEPDRVMVITLESIDDEIVSVRAEVTIDEDDVVYRLRATGTYDSSSLIARSVEVVTELDTSTPVVVDGTSETLVSSLRSTRVYAGDVP